MSKTPPPTIVEANRDETKPVILGVVGVLVGPGNRAIVNAADFEMSGYGGFTLAHSQQHRVRRRLAINLVRAVCADFIAASTDGYDAEQMLNRLLTKDGFKLIYVAVGHAPEEIR